MAKIKGFISIFVFFLFIAAYFSAKIPVTQIFTVKALVFSISLYIFQRISNIMRDISYIL